MKHLEDEDDMIVICKHDCEHMDSTKARRFYCKKHDKELNGYMLRPYVLRGFDCEEH